MNILYKWASIPIDFEYILHNIVYYIICTILLKSQDCHYYQDIVVVMDDEFKF